MCTVHPQQLLQMTQLRCTVHPQQVLQMTQLRCSVHPQLLQMTQLMCTVHPQQLLQMTHLMCTVHTQQLLQMTQLRCTVHPQLLQMTHSRCTVHPQQLLQMTQLRCTLHSAPSAAVTLTQLRCTMHPQLLQMTQLRCPILAITNFTVNPTALFLISRPTIILKISLSHSLLQFSWPSMFSLPEMSWWYSINLYDILTTIYPLLTNLIAVFIGRTCRSCCIELRHRVSDLPTVTWRAYTGDAWFGRNGEGWWGWGRNAVLRPKLLFLVLFEV